MKTMSRNQIRTNPLCHRLLSRDKVFRCLSNGGWNYKPQKSCLLTQARKKTTTNIGSQELQVKETIPPTGVENLFKKGFHCLRT
jgi:hypothetical protein